LKAINPLGKKLLLISGIVLLLFIGQNGTLVLVTSSTLSGYLTEQISRELTQKAVEVNQRLLDVVARKKNLLALLAADVNLTIAVKRHRFEALPSLFANWRQDTEFQDFLLVTQEGDIIAHPGDELGSSVAEQDWFAEARRDGISRIHYDPAPEAPPFCWLLAPLDIWEVRYYLLAKVNWRELTAFLDPPPADVMPPNLNRYTLILDDRQNILYQPAFLGQPATNAVAAFSLGADFLGRVRGLQGKEPATLHDVKLLGEEHCVGFASSRFPSWTVLCLRKESEAHAIIAKIYRHNTTISLLLLAFGFTVMFILLRKLTAPFRQLIQVTNQISAGKYPDQIQIRADAEIMQIIAALNHMISEVRAQKEQVNKLYDQEKQAATELAASNAMLAKQSAALQAKNAQVEQAFAELSAVQEDLLAAERLAVVGETSGRVAHEVLNPITAIMFRVEKDISRWSDLQDALTAMAEVVADWREQFEQGSLADYLSTSNEQGATYGAEDFALLQKSHEQAKAAAEQRQQNLQFVFTQIQRVIKIINALRESAITARTIATFPVSQPLREAVDLLDDSLRKRKITVNTAIPAQPHYVKADLSELTQLFTNLLRNAMQSIDKKRDHTGLISAGIKATDDGRVEIRITDNGVGIPREIQAGIFDQNFTTKEKQEGSGLGLAISRRFAREYGGELLLEKSVEGSGSTFLVILPVCAGPGEG